MLKGTQISYSIGEKALLHDFNIHVEPGDFVALVGPNGAGKSTALRILCGELAPTSGNVTLEGKLLSAIPAREQARTRACFEQNHASDFPFTVHEIAALGRHPHQDRLFESARDHAVVNAAMADAGVAHLADRQQQTLSGGEATRAHLARVLAQEPRLLLLDEPTNHLDIHYQQEIMRLCHARSREGCAVVAVLHDLNLAARYASRIIVLHNGRTVVQGPPCEALTPEIIRSVYGIDCVVWRHPSGCPWVVPLLESGRAKHTSSTMKVPPERQGARTMQPIGHLKSLMSL